MERKTVLKTCIWLLIIVFSMSFFSVNVNACTPSGLTYSNETEGTFNVGSGGDCVYSYVANGNNGISGKEYVVHIFDSTGSSSFTPPDYFHDLDVLIVAGGGGGGTSTTFSNAGSGGGGSGGLIYRSDLNISSFSTPISINVGSGGTSPASGNTPGNNGGDSLFDSIRALGGGGGAGGNMQGRSGGSGGGSRGALGGIANQPSSAFGGFGNRGGNSGNSPAGAAATGGGGAGSNAENLAGVAGEKGGNGGSGLRYNITGISFYYAGGGGGGAAQTNTPVGTGGQGGGGTGGNNNIFATAGIDGTGGGGGGGNNNIAGARGGSGIIVLRYLKHIVPTFYNNSIDSVLFNNGTGIFRVNVNNTNSSVYLNVDGSSVLASHIGSGIYQASHYFNLPGSYSYNWSAFGNQSYESFGYSNNYNYEVIEVLGPNLNFENPTPNDGITSINNSFIFNVSYSNSSIYYVSEMSKLFFEFNTIEYMCYDDSLVVMMNFDNNSNLDESYPNVLDNSIFNNSGIFVGNSQFSSFGKFKGSAYFDGTNDWIEVANNSSLNFGNKFSFEAWIYDSSTDAQPRGIVSKRINMNSQVAFSIFRWNNRYLYFDIGNTGNRHSTSVALPSNEWIHIAVTFDGNLPENERKKFYYNGNLVATTPSSFNSIPISSADLTIGILNKNYGDSWDGYIDKIRLYNKTLSNDEIVFSYNSNLFKEDNYNWYFLANVSNLVNGEYNYSSCGFDSLGQKTCINRSLIVDMNNLEIDLLYPLNNTKVVSDLDDFTISYNVSSGIGLMDCEIYFNGILELTSACNNGVNYDNITAINGLNSLYVKVIDSTSNVSFTDEISFYLIKNYNVSFTKSIYFENLDQYRIDYKFVNNNLRSISVRFIDIVKDSFISGSFNPVFTIKDILFNLEYIFWDLNVNDEDFEEGFYSITGVDDYKLSENYVIGVD